MGSACRVRQRIDYRIEQHPGTVTPTHHSGNVTLLTRVSNMRLSAYAESQNSLTIIINHRASITAYQRY